MKRFVILCWIIPWLLGPLSTSKGDDGVWEKVGQPSTLTKFRDISVCMYVQSRRIVAAESSETSRIWRSDNGGTAWLQPTGGLTENHYYKQIIMRPSDGVFGWALVPGNSYTDEVAGPYKTENYGQDWDLREQGLENLKDVRCLAVNINSQDLNTAYVGCTSSETYNTKIKRTTNGFNWYAWDIGIPEEMGSVVDISLCEIDPSYMYCAYWEQLWGAGSGLYYSPDAGETWQREEFDGAAIPNRVVVCPTNRNVVYVVEHTPNYGRIHVTTNGGTAWTYLPNSSSTADVSQIEFTRQGTGQRIYVTYSSSTNGEFHNHLWLMETGPDDRPKFLPSAGRIPGDRCVFSIGVNPDHPDSLYIGCRKMFYTSSDAGATFTEMPGIYPQRVSTVAVDLPLIMMQAGDMTFSTSDFGQHFFSEAADTFGPAAIVRDWGTDDWILGGRIPISGYGGVGVMFYYPYDFDGTGPLLPTWKEVDLWDGTAVDCITADPYNDYVYIGANPAFTEIGRIYHGTIAEGFEYYSPTLYDVYRPMAIDVRPGKDTVIAGGLEFGVHRSPDRGQTWEAIGHNLQSLVLSAQYCPNQPKMAVAGTQVLGVWKCRNMDALNEPPNWPVWEHSSYGMEEGWDIQALKFHPVDNSIVLAFSNFWPEQATQTYLSADTARSWIPMGEGLDNFFVHQFAVDILYPDTFYAATDDGVYKLKNPVKSGVLPSEPTTQTWGPGTVIVNGDVTVPAGVTLTIQPGTTVKFVYNFDKSGSGASNTKSEIIVYGTLIAGGETGNGIVFQSSRHELAPNQNDWYGIIIEDGGKARLSHCSIQDNEQGITSENYIDKPDVNYYNEL